MGLTLRVHSLEIQGIHTRIGTTVLCQYHFVRHSELKGWEISLRFEITPAMNDKLVY